jgi:23S rRNA pseudouridine2605 synthase
MNHRAKHRPPRPGGNDDADRGPGERLQKVLAAAGHGSRRDCEDLIREGRVEVDRQVITELGTRVDPLHQEIRVDGEALRQPKRLYFAVNKPVGVVTTNHDPSGRARVIDLVPTEERVFAVGRLDRSSEGLILVTNDGEFANRLTHPRYGVEKTYLVRVAGSPDARQLDRLKKGVHLAEGFARAQSIVVKKHHGHSTDLVIVLNEGRNREIRRILARVGHKVLALKRLAVGRVKLGDLPLGGWRRLMPGEVEALLHIAKVKRREGKPKAGRSRRERPDDKLAPSAGEATHHAAGPPSDDQYLQKQALLAEPLSLDDLLRDDLDEGPIAGPLVAGGDEVRGTEIDEIEPGAPSGGGIIDYEDDFSAPPPKPARRPKQRAAGKPQRPNRGKRGHERGTRGERSELEPHPRESFGKKRGGKRAFGPPEEGRGPAGAKTGKIRFRPKRKKADAQAEGRDNQRRGQRRGKQSKHEGNQGGRGKQGGKRKGRR